MKNTSNNRFLYKTHYLKGKLKLNVSLRTIFTGVDRYNYVDPDYAYTNDERMKIEVHKLIYQNYIRELKFFREEKIKTKY